MNYGTIIADQSNRFTLEVELTTHADRDGSKSEHQGRCILTKVREDLFAVESNANKSIECLTIRLTIPLQDYKYTLIPDTGRWYMNSTSPISTWRFSHITNSRINSIFTPIFAFERADENVDCCGIITNPTEIDFEIVEPASNRALNVHHRRLVTEFRIWSPTPTGTQDNSAITTILAYIFLPSSKSHQTWQSAVSQYSQIEKELLGVEGNSWQLDTFAPYWCTWVDWGSDAVTGELVERQVDFALEAGISNIILDDGWFGPGLDSDYSIELNIGDWRPDVSKYPDLARTIQHLQQKGAKVLLWYAPHAVGPASQSYINNYGFLIHDGEGNPIQSSTRFFSLCFQNPESRKLMRDTAEALVEQYCLDGIKYDLFNWAPQSPCAGCLHTHDEPSAIAGLHRLFRELPQYRIKDSHRLITEIKQDYATGQLARLATLVRGGDSPYGSYTNFERLKYIQARGMRALNDYQTFRPESTAEDIARLGLRMLALGIPAWGCDFEKLGNGQLLAIRQVNFLYSSLLKLGLSPTDRKFDDQTAVLSCPAGSIVVAFSSTYLVDCPADTIGIINASYSPRLLINSSHSLCLTRLLDLTSSDPVKIYDPPPAGISQLDIPVASIWAGDTLYQACGGVWNVE